MNYRECTTTSADGVRLYYRDYAPACAPKAASIPLLMLPGLTRSSRDFGALAGALQPRHRIIAPDLRGRGQSGWADDAMTYTPIQYVKDLKIVLAAADMGRFAIIGTSLGGLLAMTMAGLMRHRLAGVVLNDIGPDIDPKGIARIQSYVGKSGPVESWDDAIAATKAINGAAFPGNTDDDWRKMAQALYAERDGKIAPNYDPDISKPFSAGASTPAPSMWPFYNACIGLPTLIIRGETSDILSADTLQAMLSTHAEARHVVVRGVGHAPTLNEAEARAAILEFVDALPVKEGVINWIKNRMASLSAITSISKQMKAAAKAA